MANWVIVKFGIDFHKFCDKKQRKRNGIVHRCYYLNKRGQEMYEKYIKLIESIHEEGTVKNEDDIIGE